MSLSSFLFLSFALSLIKMTVGASDDIETCSYEACEPQEKLNGFLWSRLPDEVMDLVLAWLPLSSFFRMRCVCKKWNNVINSRSFFETYSRVPTQTACFLHLIRVNGVLMAAFHDPVRITGSAYLFIPFLLLHTYMEVPEVCCVVKG